ncbi:transcriptional regulatory protein ZraR [Geobacter sp. OR-1]|uniref:sigma-54-dependent transcriptional regulator n=1 Tax=Geobacter sp. OR-1 TaxID=1266765 RepID=UPI0005433B5D|nr:sigma-54 dependent transcriptional regulator [Geobacter sp. OR-1]GAM11623.1 transcriptional regulatory protein ZraR [Geobacter sp. OR-1]
MIPENFHNLPVLLVDDDPQALELLESFLRSSGMKYVVTFEDGRDLTRYLASFPAAVIVLDLMMPKISGITLLEEITNKNPGISVIVVTAEQQIDTAIECMKLGAVDYLTKPVVIKRFISSVNRALELYSLNEEIVASQNNATADEQHAASIAPYIITQNKEMLSLIRYVKIIADSFQPILISGETGVGKELFAQAIHTLSKREGMFVSVNVAGLDDTLFSDTLFGHKKGSYTGAISDRDGLIKKAANGTLFLDEIGDLNELSQIKLLRLLQENEYYPIGSDIPVQNNARLLVATNQHLKLRMIEGKFRKDLYYRLCSHQVNIPPLRSRLDDIPLLLNHYMTEYSNMQGKNKLTYRKELVNLLSTYDFPGNVRELQAMILDVVTRSSDGKIHVSSFKDLIAREKGSHFFDTELSEEIDFNPITFTRFPTIKEAETELIKRALELSNNNQGIAAQMLGITRQALNNRLRRKKAN